MLGSLRVTLLAWVLFPLATTVAIDAWVSYQDALATASLVQDRMLLGSARSIAQQIHYEDGALQYQIPPAALELFQSEQPDHIYYRVTTSAGRLLAGYTELERPPGPVEAGSPVYFSTRMRAAPVRVVAMQQMVVGEPAAQMVLVQVAQTMVGHQHLAMRLWTQTLLRQVLMLALATVLILFGLQRGLRPLLRLRARVNAREPGALRPLSSEGTPTELLPLVHSLNDYIMRLEQHTNAQNVFLQNAAHQLRTPFAVLHAQLNYAVRADDAKERADSLAAAYRTLQHAVRLLNQLLTLSAAESTEAAADQSAGMPLQLTEVAQEVLEALAPQAHAKHIDLGLEQADAAPMLEVPRHIVRVIVMNLVDNAIRYTPENGRVTVRIDRHAGRPLLVVEDNGKGIPADQRERVFERFFRLDNTDSDGSGLGLAIVREFARHIGATVSLDSPGGAGGLLVRVVFALPAAAAPDHARS
ncbi:MAG: sensor histidine kinase [Rhodoferax sp.]